MIRVLLVDDQALIRQAISVMLDATDDITIVGQGDTGLDAIAMAQRLQPDVVLMDIRMPELDGIAATEKICGDPDLAATRVLILTTFENDTNIVAALRAGASAQANPYMPSPDGGGAAGRGQRVYRQGVRAGGARPGGAGGGARGCAVVPLGDPEFDYPHATTHRDRPGAVCEPGAH